MDDSEAPAKRQKVDDDLYKIDARELLRIQFFGKGIPHSKVSVQPEYTHQVFDNEQVVDVAPEDGKVVTIEVNCMDLQQEVRFCGEFPEKERAIILQSLSRALPANDENRPSSAETGKSGPPGQLLCTFLQPAHHERFELYRATAKDSGASDLLHRGEKLAVWFIETADSVDFSDERWEVLFLYARSTADIDRNNAPEPVFVGYMTLFSFRNPIHGTKVRVCQALVLPPWQGRGLGREMLLRVYEHAVYARDEVSELTVEDPCEGFQRLRDAVDLELLVRRYPALLKPLATGGVNTADTSALSDDGGNQIPDEADLAKAMKIIRPQAQFLHECVDFCGLVRDTLKSGGPAVTGGSTEQSASVVCAADPSPAANTAVRVVDAATIQAHPRFKEFRLSVKKRILKNDKDIAALPKADKQQALTEEFEVEFKRFLALLSTARRLALV